MMPSAAERRVAMPEQFLDSPDVAAVLATRRSAARELRNAVSSIASMRWRRGEGVRAS